MQCSPKAQAVLKVAEASDPTPLEGDGKGLESVVVVHVPLAFFHACHHALVDGKGVSGADVDDHTDHAWCGYGVFGRLGVLEVVDVVGPGKTDGPRLCAIEFEHEASTGAVVSAEMGALFGVVRHREMTPGGACECPDCEGCGFWDVFK